MKKVVVIAIIFLALFISGCTGSMEIAITPTPTPSPNPAQAHEGMSVPSQTPDNSTASTPALSSTPTLAPTQVQITTTPDNQKGTSIPTPKPSPTVTPTATPTPTPASTPTPIPTPRPLVKAGDTVSVDYTGRYDNGDTFDASSISFTVGTHDVLPGFENAVIGMTVGESKVVAIPPSEAYGEYDPALIKPVNMSEFDAKGITPVVGMPLDNMYYWQIRVDSIDTVNNIVYVDFNHPLAGKTLHFEIILRSIN